MLRKLTTLLFFIFISTLVDNVRAQEVFMGHARKFNFKYSQYGIIGQVNKRNIIYRSNDNNYSLDVYSDSMKLVNTIPLSFIPKRTAQVFFINLKDKIACVYVVDEKGSLVIYGAAIKDNGEIIFQKKKIHEDKKNWYASEKNVIHLKASNDKSKIAVMTHGGKQKDEFSYFIIDSSLSLVWKGKTSISSKSLGDFIAYNYMEVSNSGHIFFPCFSNNNSGTLYDIDLIHLRPENPNEFKQTEVGGDKTYFNDLIIRINDFENFCQVSGTYKTSRNGKIEGLYSTLIPFSSNNSPKTYLSEFHEDFLKKVKSKNYKKAFNDYRIQEIIFRKDGGCTVIAEEQNFEIKNVYHGGYMGFNTFYSDPTYYTTNKEYTFGNIIIINMDKDGHILWSEHIRKSQRSRDDNGDFSSYTLLNSGHNLVFIYNLFNSADQSIGLSSVDPSGFLQMSKLNTLQRYEEWLMKSGVQISPLQVLVPVLGAGELNFALVNFR